MHKVLIPTKLSDVAANTLKTAGYEVIQDADTPLDVQVTQHPDTTALIVRSEKVTSDIINALPYLKLVVRAGAGYDNIDIVYARKKNIDVMNTPGANSNAVAEEVMALILAHYRHIVPADATTRQGLWEKKKYMGHELTRKTVGIIGLGNIGRNLVKRLQGFEPMLLGYDHFLARQRALNIGVTPTSIEDIFSQCDIVTLHVPGGPATRNMVSTELLNRMKDGAVLINCSRYGVVDEEALAEVKASGKKIYYLTDVHPQDAPGEKPSAAVADLMMPHLGASTVEANTKAAKRAAEQMIAYFSEGDTSCVVNGESPIGLNPSNLLLANLLAEVARKAGGDKPIRRVDCTFYGNLRSYRKWFTAPILEGLLPNAEKGLMPVAAEESLREHGIVFKARDPKDDMPYEDSITLNVAMEENGEYHHTIVRGVVAEGIPMVSRINAINGLYVDLRGTTLFFHYKDKPGIIAIIAAALSEQGINIDNIAAPTDHGTETAMTVIKTNKPVSEELLSNIAKQIEALFAFSMNH